MSGLVIGFAATPVAMAAEVARRLEAALTSVARDCRGRHPEVDRPLEMRAGVAGIVRQTACFSTGRKCVIVLLNGVVAKDAESCG